MDAKMAWEYTAQQWMSEERTHLSWNEKNVNPFLQPYKSENEKEPFSII